MASAGGCVLRLFLKGESVASDSPMNSLSNAINVAILQFATGVEIMVKAPSEQTVPGARPVARESTYQVCDSATTCRISK
ncbi:hypothetical protein SAMD00023353_1102480 [Rosellinia necatrix]|uniref:Uncharacterized protein n=1 Tax=Rosellinia necatrix TaxID=77044 RepID=A0A1S8A7K7_ROSNE|nr:hypothetical protein SAMD00023353_1102480 [Rosellinia necatrix]